MKWQRDRLFAKRLLLSPISDLGRGGPARNGRYSGSCLPFEGCIVGCLFSNVLDFARGSRIAAARAARQMRACFAEAAARLSTCSGSDCAYLRNGLGCYKTLRSQLKHLHQSKHRVDSRVGGSNVAIGLAAALVFAITLAAEDTSACAEVSAGLHCRLCDALRLLERWETTMVCGNGDAAVAAEMRALRRALLAANAAREAARARRMDLYNRLLLELACIRRAVWPRGCRVDAGSQAGLLSWIQSDGFVDACALPTRERPQPLEIALPLSSTVLPSLLPRCVADDAASLSSGSTSQSSTASSDSEVPVLPQAVRLQLERNFERSNRIGT